MPSKIYHPGSLPSGTSWVYLLNASDAVTQCQIFGLQSEPTLARNRIILSEFLNQLQLNGGTQPLPENNRPDIDFDGRPDGPPPDGVQLVEFTDTHTPQTNSTTVASSDLTVTPAPSIPVSLPLPSLAISSVNTTSTSAHGCISHTSVPHPTSISPSWQDVVHATAIAVGQQVASAMAQARVSSPPSSSSTPQVVSELLRTLPVISGDDSDQLLSFLVQVRKIEQLKLTSSENLVISILPHTAGQLRTFWSQAIADRTSIFDLIASLLNFFAPHQLRHSMISKLVYRPQGSQETLPEFVEKLRDYATLLLPDLGDRELLDIALNGLNRHTRAHLAGLPIPTSLQDLLTLAPRIEVVRNLERGTAVFPKPNNFHQQYSQPQRQQSPGNQFRSYTHRHSQSPNQPRSSNPHNFQNVSEQHRNRSSSSFTPRVPDFPFAHFGLPGPNQQRYPPPNSPQGNNPNSDPHGHLNPRGGRR